MSRRYDSKKKSLDKNAKDKRKDGTICSVIVCKYKVVYYSRTTAMVARNLFTQVQRTHLRSLHAQCIVP